MSKSGFNLSAMTVARVSVCKFIATRRPPAAKYGHSARARSAIHHGLDIAVIVDWTLIRHSSDIIIWDMWRYLLSQIEVRGDT